MHVVRKRLKVRGRTDEFNREDKCLRLLNQLKHPNIIPLWGSYTYQEEHNFLFPYIDMDLGKFLMAKTRHEDFRWDFTFYSALTGLASALSKTHRLHLKEDEHGVDFEAIGYHHDLRPPNVLVSHDTFILADFGLGSLKDSMALSHTPYKPISGDYIAPECTDMEENPQTVNRGIDVWAFGCLIAETVTYILRGVEGVQGFRKKRLTTGRFPRMKDAGFYQPHGEVKQEVLDWMEALKPEDPQQDLVYPLIELSLDALQTDPRSRPNMDEVYQRLAVQSLLKHFHSVQTMFIQICVAGGQPAAPKHHLESLRSAQERLEIWGQTLGLRGSDIPSDVYESSESYVKVLRSLFHILLEEPERRTCGQSSALRSLQDQTHQRIKELWDLLPKRLIPSLDNDRYEKASGSGHLEQRLDPSGTVQGDMPRANIPAPTDALLAELERAALSFKDGLPISVPLEDVLKATSIEDVYDVTDNIQADQELRNLCKIQPYLEHLKDYADVVNDIIGGCSHVLELLWGPVALLLQWSSTFDKAYDSIINAAAEIGKALPDFRASGAIFSQNTERKEVLVLFFKDILQFYRVTLEPFTHPGN